MKVKLGKGGKPLMKGGKVVTKEDCCCCLFIVTVTMVTAGTQYTVGEVMKPVFGTLCPPADGFGFQVRVDAVDGAGAVTAYHISVFTIGYITPPANPVGFAGTIGHGFTANCTFA